VKSKKLGFLCSDFGPAQLNYQLITSGNELLRMRDDVDLSLFYCNNTKLVAEPKFGVYCLFECYSFVGNLVTTSIQTTSRALTYVGPARAGPIYYFLNDLCWTRLNNRQYEPLADIYLHARVKLIARSQPHFDIISSVWKEPVGIAENACVADFVKIIYGEN
jgi:hypothetical protein